ncbi:MAG TPA: alpha/beta hydrolase-fold protein [Pseudomonas sp.]|uniref:alpha/beta hydrolase n=1 Tax=Pseudomonas sp. TaxID=306 RepID=UPI002C6DC6BB|nr:alpha/beta hydrolase-fold protein [Pseudomonas sp.]HRL94446.1 alpha/beta hydrolase-fold protein [Pseudomonas sp.]
MIALGWLRNAATLIGALLLGGLQAAQAEPAPLDGSEQWLMKSAEGRDYRIMVSLPEGDVPYTGGYPVIYIIDGNALFPAFHAAKRVQERWKGAILVAIGYPSDTPYDFNRRAFDLSPPQPAERNDPPQGGQDLFLDFIEKRLMPKVNERFKVDQDQRSLVGWSFGGMFGVYSLFTRPALFQHVVAISPSLWWRDRYLLAHERAFTEQAHTGKLDLTHTSLSIWAGDREMPQEIQDVRALQRRLENLSQYGLRSDFQLEAGEDHMSIPFRVTTRVLEELLTTRRF